MSLGLDGVTVADLMRTRFSVGQSSEPYQEGFQQRLKAALEAAQPVPNPYSKGTADSDAYDGGFRDALRFLENILLGRVTIFTEDAARLVGWLPKERLSATEFFANIARSRN